MDAEKLSKLEEKLYNETPILGERIRQQAVKQLVDLQTPESINLLAKSIVFSKDKNIKNIASTALRQIKIQDTTLINAICEVWEESRDEELIKLIKSKGWIPSQLELSILVSVKIGFSGIIERQRTSVVLPLLNLFDDQDIDVAKTAKQWALSFVDIELQKEVCRLASEEGNKKALEIAAQAGYAPEDVTQAALFYYITAQWDKYQQVDPDYKLLENIYYSGSEELQTRINEKGQNLRRLEWVWMILGGKEGRRLPSISNQEWEKIMAVLSGAKQGEEMWSLAFMTPIVWTTTIIEKLQKSKWLPKNPEDKTSYNNWITLAKKCEKQPPKGKLVRCVHTLEGHTRPIESMLITPDGQSLVSAGDELIRVWNIEKGELVTTLKGHLKSVTSLVLSQDGQLLASASRDKTLCMWRLPEGNLVQNFSTHIASAWSLDMTTDGKILASGSYQEMRIWQYPAGKLFKTLKGHKREVDLIKISSDNSLVVTAGGMKDNTLRLWELPSGQHLQTLQGHKDIIRSVVISPDNRILATGSRDNTIRLWKLPQGEEIATLEGHTGDVWCLGITPDGQILVTGSQDNTVKLWKLVTGQLLKTLEGHTDAVWCLAISQQGDLLATGSKDNTVRLWRLPDGENMGVLVGHTQPIKCIGITPDGQTLASASNDKTLRLWNWDLLRLCNIPIPLLTDADHQWIREALSNKDITEDERYWLIFLNELIHNYIEKKTLCN